MNVIEPVTRLAAQFGALFVPDRSRVEINPDSGKIFNVTSRSREEIGVRVLSLRDLKTGPRPEEKVWMSAYHTKRIIGSAALLPESEALLANVTPEPGRKPSELRNRIRNLVERAQNPDDDGKLENLSLYRLKTGTFILNFITARKTEAGWDHTPTQLYFDAQGAQLCGEARINALKPIGPSA